MKPLRAGGPMDEHMQGLENVWALEDMLEPEVGSELVIEELELELVTAVSLVVLAPVHLLVDPGVAELEIVGLHADCLVELGGDW